LEMWLSQERSWQIVRPRSLNERTSSRGLLMKSVGVGVGDGVPDGPFRET